MSKLLIYIGENKKFDVETTIGAITSMGGTSKARRGNFIGAIFECEYTANGRNTIVRISPEAETITAEGLGDESLAFALELQRASPVPLHAIDMEYSFNVPLIRFGSILELKQAISAGMRG
jgi:hypothetical protein